MRQFRYLDIVTALFVAVLLISNIASSAKVVDLGFSIVGLRLSFDGGTLLFPLSYIFDDILTEVYGYARARRVIWIGFAASLLMSLCFAVLSALPADGTWATYAGNTQFNTILGGVSTGAIILASLAAYACGEFSNSYVLAKMKLWTEGKFLWTRTIGSTLVGEGLDTMVFVTIATALGVFPWSLYGTLLLSNYLFKVTIEVILTPCTYGAVGFLKRQENVDFYDRGTNFNPFKLFE